MFWLRWILGGVLFLISAWIITLNASVFWKGYVRRNQVSSWIPLLGGLSGISALFIIPNPSLRYLWWVPLILDWGCVGGFTHQIIFSLRKKS